MSAASSTHPHQIGIDVGGTFTDLVVATADGGFRTLKVLSTPAEFSAGIVDGFNTLVDAGVLRPAALSRLVHAFTVATNALLTRQGARVGLITTAGFRDVLEIGRLRMPRLYDMDWDKPLPLVPRRHRCEVDERLAADGSVVRALDIASVDRAISALLAAGVDSIAVCLLHAYRNPAHEQQVVARVTASAPHVAISASHRVLPEIREYERTSTTVVNAYVKPVVDAYLGRLEASLHEAKVEAPLLIMQSAGGVMQSAAARELPAYCIESGPAAGAIGAAALGRMLGLQNVIAFDMGGTTAKACLIENGEPRLTDELEVGAGLNSGQRLLKGGGYVVRAPTLDLAEIGAGGGSLAWVDRGGALRVGPASAGALPGPACYARGGSQPTVTDANVVLGFLNRSHLLDGAMPLDASAAERAIRQHIAEPLGLSLEAAAWGIHAVADATMARAVQAVSSEIGRSPADFTMIAFGGSGPVHAATLAVHAGMTQIVVPPAPGVFSAFGLLFARIEHRLVRTCWVDTATADFAAIEDIFLTLRAEGAALLRAEGLCDDDAELVTLLDLRYAGQSSELPVAVDLPLTREALDAAVAVFEREHHRSYGYANPGERTQIVNLRLRARARQGSRLDLRASEVAPALSSAGPRRTSARRRVYFGAGTGWHDTDVVRRDGVTPRRGPLIVEEYDTTIVVPPGAAVALDATGSVRISLAAQA